MGQINAAVYRNMQMLLSSKLQGLDIKNGQYDFFYVISLYEGMSQKQLGEHLHISKSTTAKAVKNLVNKGYVEKQKDQQDNRIDRLYLTELGKEIAPTVAEIFRENLAVASKGLSREEEMQFILLMQKVLDNLVEENSRLTEGENDVE